MALATTTHFMPFPGVVTVTGRDVDEVRDALRETGVVCVAAPAGRAAGAAGKLGPAALAPAELARIAGYVLVEADGQQAAAPQGARRLGARGARGVRAVRAGGGRERLWPADTRGRPSAGALSASLRAALPED